MQSVSLSRRQRHCRRGAGIEAASSQVRLRSFPSAIAGEKRCKPNARRKYVRLKLVGRVAQVVEQRPFKAWVAGSNPAALTNPTFSRALTHEPESVPKPHFFPGNVN